MTNRASIKSYNKPYSKSKSGGKGWYEKSVYFSSLQRKVAPLHRKAALKGKPPSRYGSITSAQIHTKMGDRSKRSQLMDRSLQAKRVGNIRNKRDRSDWANRPDSMDLQGVDTKIADAQYQARFSKKLLKEKHQQKRKLTKRIHKKKEQVKQVEKPEEKKEIKEEIKEAEEEKEKVELDIKNVEVGHRELKKSIYEKGEEKRNVLYVMKATQNNNYIESKSLISRAKHQGFEYDQVDWDSLQGTDLTYSDRVRRLDDQVGKTYSEQEFEDKYDEMYAHWEETQGRPS